LLGVLRITCDVLRIHVVDVSEFLQARKGAVGLPDDAPAIENHCPITQTKPDRKVIASENNDLT